MKHLFSNTKFTGALVVVVVAALLYYWYSSGSTPLLSDSSNSPASVEILRALEGLHTVTLDSTVFEDPVFNSLSDFGVVIPPEPVGRRNPFAPAGN